MGRIAVVRVLFLSCLVGVAYGVEPQKPASPDFSKEGFVIEQSDEKLVFENDGTNHQELRARVRIQSDAGVEHYSVVKFAFESASDTFAVDYVRVIKPDGSTVVTPPDTYQDMPAEIARQAPFYSDEHEMQVAVKGLGVGDMLEYQAHWQHNKALIPGQFWFAYDFDHEDIVRQETLEVSVPHGRSIKLKSEKEKPTISTSGQYDVYSWAGSNLQEKDDKQRKQEEEETLWQTIRGRKPVPEIELSTFQSWDELGKWYYGLQRDRVQPTAEIQAKATELTKGLPDDDAKIRALYDFVSTKYRYIGIAFGIGRYQPHAAADVLENQYGDCKDKHTLFASLLAAAGIKAYPALISTEHEIDPDVPSPGQFDHVITAIPQKSGILWLDTTAEVAPFGLLLSPLRGKHALVIAGDKPAALLATTDDDPFPTLQEFKMDATLSDAGVLEGKAENTDRGDAEVLFRIAFRLVPVARWKDLVQQISYRQGFGGDVSDVEVTSPEKTSEAFHYTYSYKRKDYSDWSNRRISPPLPLLILPAVDEDVAPLAPIWLGSPGKIDFHATIKLPKDYTPVLPSAVHVKRDFADYDSTYSFADGVVTSHREMVVKLREIPPAEYTDYKSFRKAVDDDYNSFTSLSAPSGATAPRSISSLFVYQNEIWSLPDSEIAEAGRRYDDAKEQAQSNNVPGEIDALQKAVALDPKFTRAWLWLGEAYKYERQSDLAIQSYRKAIEVDPKLPVGYKALGSTLALLGRSDEAIATWQELIKVAPDKPDGYASLGLLLLGLRRYREAVAPLESAVRLLPGQAGLQAALGQAYLYSGENDKALAAFQEVGKEPSAPVLLNNAAYELAEMDVGLDTAKDFARRAVADEEIAASKLEISQMSYPDHAGTLATFWDTLGWVYFRLNDFAAAEKYLAAAWQVSQSPVTGNHLGNLYEKQGKRAAALHMYLLAHSAGALWKGSLIEAPRFGGSQPNIDGDLERLGGKPDPGKAVTELNAMRTFDLPRIVKGQATANFYVLLGPGKKVEVKFQSGDDSLKPAEKLLVNLNYKFTFPDDGSERLPRNGILGCYPYSGCSFVFTMPSDSFVPPNLSRVQ